MAQELLCIDDVDPYARELTDPLAELAQDLYHRLLETPGSNLDDEERGLGLEDMLSSPLRPNLAQLVQGECEKDDRVVKCRALVTEVQKGNGPSTVTIALTLTVDIDGLNVEGYAITIVRDASGLHLVRKT